MESSFEVRNRSQECWHGALATLFPVFFDTADGGVVCFIVLPYGLAFSLLSVLLFLTLYEFVVYFFFLFCLSRFGVFVCSVFSFLHD